MELLRKHHQRIINIAALAALAVCFALTVRTAWYATQILDGDASAEMALANLLYREGGIFAKNWIYSTEICAFYCAQIFRLFFGLFEDWHLVRFAGTVTLLAMYLASWGGLSRRLKAGTVGFGLGGCLLMLPFSVVYGRIVLYHSYYICYAIEGFLIVTLNLALWQDRRALHRCLHGAALFLVALISGLSGVRLMLTTIAPLLCAALCSAVHFRRDEEPAAKQWLGILLRLIPGGIAAVGFGAGYLINSRVLAAQYNFSSYDSTWLREDVPNILHVLLKHFFVDFGYDADRPLMSVQGVLSVLGVLAALALLVLAVWAMLSKSTTEGEQLLGGLAGWACGIIGLCFLLVRLSTEEDYYYCLHMLLSVLWLVPLPAVMLGTAIREDRLCPDGRRTLSLLCAGVLGCNGLVVTRFFTDPDSWQLTYEGLTWQDTRTAQQLQGAVDFLTANGYTLGGADTWYDNIITELSDGRVRAFPILNYQDHLYAYYWLMDTTLLTPKDGGGRSFILLSVEDVAKNTAMLESIGAEQVYADEYFAVYGLPDEASLLNALTPYT